MTIVDQIRDFVESECQKPTSKYGLEPFLGHFVPMTKLAVQLADELGGDKEVVEIAAWLHDIGSIVYGRKNHHLTGAKIAEEKLRQLNYSAAKIELVKNCILHHRGSEQNSPTTIEEQIIIEADAMSNFANITGIFKAALVYENLSQIEAKAAVRQKLQNKWQQLRFETSKKTIKPLFDAAMLLLS